MKRRYFFKALASGLAVAVAPELFLPKLIKLKWKIDKIQYGLWTPFEEENLGTLTGTLVLQRTLPLFAYEYPQFSPVWSK